MKKLASILLLASISAFTFSQGHLTKTAYVSFYSKMEDVKAENFSGTSELNTETGELLFSFAIQSFKFENATMQQHFNEADVMNSKEFPKAKFVGLIINNADVKYTVDSEYPITVKGELTIKDKTNTIETKGMIKVEGGKIYSSATFTLDRFEYGVKGKAQSISQVLDLTVKAEYEKI